MAIITRNGKGSELTYTELDGNFTQLDTRTIDLGWRDLIMGVDVKNTGANIPTLQNFRDGIFLWGFDPDSNQEVYCQAHIDHDYAMGTVMYPHVHFSVNVTNTGTVRWGIEYTLARRHDSTGQTHFPASTTVYVEHDVDGDPYAHYVAEVSLANTIPATHLEVDTVILFRVFRDASHVNDTFPGTAYLITTDIHYQVDRYATLNKAPNFYA
jgi:hypothetical protein